MSTYDRFVDFYLLKKVIYLNPTTFDTVSYSTVLCCTVKHSIMECSAMRHDYIVAYVLRWIVGILSHYSLQHLQPSGTAMDLRRYV